MSVAPSTVGKMLAGAILIVAYAIAVDFTNSHPDHRTLGALLAVAPLVLLLVDVLRRWRARVLAVAAFFACAVALVVGWQTLEAHFDRVLLAQQAIAYASLSLLFAASLMPGRTPLCTQIQTLLQGPADEATRAYTRQVTIAWALLLFVIAATLTTLYVAGLRRAWSLFSNYGPLIVLPLAFAIEPFVRRQRLPQAPRIGWLDIVRAWQHRGAGRR